MIHATDGCWTACGDAHDGPDGLGVRTAQFPLEIVEQVLFETEHLSQRARDLPAHVMVYYTIALALYAEVSTRQVLRCGVEDARWLGDLATTSNATMPSKSGMSQARTRLGAAPLEASYRAAVAPIAVPDTPGAWYCGWRVMSFDGTTLDIGDTPPISHMESALVRLTEQYCA